MVLSYLVLVGLTFGMILCARTAAASNFSLCTLASHEKGKGQVSVLTICTFLVAGGVRRGFAAGERLGRSPTAART
jgi:hypothetical protein